MTMLPRPLLFVLLLAPLSTGCTTVPNQTVSVDIATPDSALAELKAGNERFVAGKMRARDLLAQVAETAGGQYPFAVVLGCIDSRVPPETVFDQGIGDIFSARVAGNFVNTDILGSMEFATALAGSQLVVVLGHSACGAIKGAADRAELGNLTAMLENLQPAIDAVEEDYGESSSKNTAFVERASAINVYYTIDRILAESPVMAERVENGDLKIVGAKYDVATGKVAFFE